MLAKRIYSRTMLAVLLVGVVTMAAAQADASSSDRRDSHRGNPGSCGVRDSRGNPIVPIRTDDGRDRMDRAMSIAARQGVPICATQVDATIVVVVTKTPDGDIDLYIDTDQGTVVETRGH